MRFVDGMQVNYVVNRDLYPRSAQRNQDYKEEDSKRSKADLTHSLVLVLEKENTKATLIKCIWNLCINKT